jgi:hypothetical protein
MLWRPLPVNTSCSAQGDHAPCDRDAAVTLRIAGVPPLVAGRKAASSAAGFSSPFKLFAMSAA